MRRRVITEDFSEEISVRICVISSRKVSISDSLRMRRSAISFLRSCVSVASCSVYAFVAESAGGKPRSLRRHHVITLKMKVTTAIRPSARGGIRLHQRQLICLGLHRDGRRRHTLLIVSGVPDNMRRRYSILPRQ